MCDYDIDEMDALEGVVRHKKSKEGTSFVHSMPKIDWIICGGETGRHARPMHPDWVRSLRDQCQSAGVPFFFKQWGEYNSEGERVGKRSSGHLLDGQEWRQVP